MRLHEDTEQLNWMDNASQKKPLKSFCYQHAGAELHIRNMQSFSFGVRSVTLDDYKSIIRIASMAKDR